MNNILLSLLLIIIINTSVSTSCIEDENIKNIFNKNNIVIESRSISGWKRLFNNPHRINEQGYEFLPHELNDVKNCLDELKPEKIGRIK